ncbi:hypothetical protein ScPMuIL_003368 [Solemya velum]
MSRSPGAADNVNIGDGGTLAYTCLPDYTAVGSDETLTCNTDTWSADISLVCKGCAAPALPTGMSRTPETAEGGVIADTSTLVYTCLSGYTKVGSDETHTCGTNTWDITSFTLACKGCPAPALPAGMSRIPTTADGAVIADAAILAYTCLSGYTADGSDETLTCNTNTWSASITLVCKVTADGAIVADAGTLVYTCKTGYTATGDVTSQTTTCGTNAWDSAVTLTCSGAQINMGFGLSVAVAAIVAHVLTTRV